MISRFAFALLFVVTGLMVAVSPVAGRVSGDLVACATQVEAQNQHHHPADEGSTAQPATTIDQTCSCCDQGCLFDPSIAGLAASGQTRVTRALGGWSKADFSDLTDPNGPRRPPRV